MAYLVVGIVASVYGWAVFASTPFYPGAIGLNYNALGADYMVFHSAVGLARFGDLATLYDPDRFTAWLNHAFASRLSQALDFRPWVYPPPFLLLLLPFSVLGFAASYLVFQVVTAAGMLAAIRGLSRRGWGWVAACGPAAACNVTSGQASFAMAGLLLGGVALLDRRPWLAGVVFGLLSFKPQFALMVPVVLLARGAWRAILAAAATALVMAGACWLWLGTGIWSGWLATMATSASGTDSRWFRAGRLWGESVYTCAVTLGASVMVANVAQAAFVLLAAGAVWFAFRSHRLADARAGAVLLTAALLAAPHAGNYDLLLPVVAAVLLLRDRPGKWDWLLAVLVWLEPVMGLPVITVAARFIPLLNAVLLGRILWTEHET